MSDFEPLPWDWALYICAAIVAAFAACVGVVWLLARFLRWNRKRLRAAAHRRAMDAASVNGFVYLGETEGLSVDEIDALMGGAQLPGYDDRDRWAS